MKNNNMQIVCYAILYEICKRSKKPTQSLKKNSVLKSFSNDEVGRFWELIVSKKVDKTQIKNLDLNLFLVLIEYVAEYILNEKIQNMSSVELAILKEFDNYQKHKRSGFGRYCFVSDIDFLESDLFESKRQKEEFFEQLFEEVYVFYIEVRQSFSSLKGNISKKKSHLKVVR